MAVRKHWYEIETRDKESALGTYAASLTDLQAADVKALLDEAVGRGLFPFYRFVPFAQARGLAHLRVQALNFAAARQAVLYDIETAQRAAARRSGGPEMGIVRLTRKDLLETARAYEEDAEDLEEARRRGQPVGPEEIYNLEYRAIVNRGLATRRPKEPELELGRAVEVRNLLDVLLEIQDRRPDLKLREHGVRGPRGLWGIGELAETVRADFQAMSPAERAGSDFSRYSWGYDGEGRVQVVHWPVRGGASTRFLEE